MIAVLVGCSGCREYWPDEVKTIYRDNADVFQQVFDICEKYQITNSVVYDYKSDYDVSYKNSLTKAEKKVISKCADIGCRYITGGYVDDRENQNYFVSFSIQHPSRYQEIIMFAENVDTANLICGGDAISLKNFFEKLAYDTSVEYEMLDKNIYYILLTPNEYLSPSS